MPMSGMWIYVWWDERRDNRGWRVAVLKKNSNGELSRNDAKGTCVTSVQVSDYDRLEENKVLRKLKTSFPEADFIIKL